MAMPLTEEQKQVVETLDKRLFVAAGAGSGKTFTLTQRILRALSDGSGPGGHGRAVEHLDRVLAITFTNAAAAEIRERVRKALLAAGMNEEALGVDDAWISTIHGMCSRILKAHALELGIDPEFEVLSGEAECSRYMDRAVNNVIKRAEAGVDKEGAACSDYRALMSWYRLAPTSGGVGKDETSISAMVRKLLELACAAPCGFDDLRLARGRVDFSALKARFEECRTHASRTSKGPETAMNAIAAIEAFEASGQTHEDLAVLMDALAKMPASSGDFTKEDLALLKAEAVDAVVNAYLAVDGRALDELLELARAVFDEYEELKREASLLDNNDLLRLTLAALRDNEAIRAAYADRFDLVMIDEFQDTDQQQIDIIGYLAGPGCERLCTVGDAQQSIYRFRGAEVEVFRRQQHAPQQEMRIVELARNFRSHKDILGFVDRVFDSSEGGVMPDFMSLEPDPGRKDGLLAIGAERCQAVLVVGGNADERRQAEATAIAERFRALHDAGQPLGDMVLLLGGMPVSGIYAAAIRAQGLPCVIRGGSVFSDMPEVKAMDALVRTLANPADEEGGLMPLLQSPMFSLGATEFMALATLYDPATREVSRRGLLSGIHATEDAPGLEGLPLVGRARAVLRAAFARVGRDSFTDIVRDVLNASGWMSRLAQEGPEGKAVAANVLKATDIVAEAEQACGNAPRRIALAFADALDVKQAPGALNEGELGAVSIMSAHSSKGLEFPVVAVAGCCTTKGDRKKMQTARNADGSIYAAAVPHIIRNVRADGKEIQGKDLEKWFESARFGGSKAWLSPELADEVCGSDSAAGAWLAIRAEEERLELEEKARLLYVACTRAREVLILALDVGVSTKDKVPYLKIDESRDLTGRVLGRILPVEDGLPQLDADRLAFEGSGAGSYELLSLADFSFDGRGGEPGPASYQANVRVVDGALVRLGASGGAEAGAADAAGAAGAAGLGAEAVLAGAGAKGLGAVAGVASEESHLGPAGAPALERFTLAYPAAATYRMAPAPPAPRDSYSYSSIARALHAEGEDRASTAARVREEDDEDGGLAVARAAAGDPTALGSAFHAAAQWMVETGADTVPAARVDALARTWGCTPEQRARLDEALARWCGSAVRREALSWAELRAEVPFFCLGADAHVERFGAYAEGSIDLLCTDPARPGEALVIDYKTGGSPAETAEQLQRKHALQAEVYADALHKAGFERVSLRFVRAEIPDPDAPSEPQVVSYDHLGSGPK